MIKLSMAIRLKEVGLDWEPKMHDFFGLPERSMDERVFVISDMLVTIDLLQEMQVVSFQGASEWALDYLVTTEVVWLPREEQLRQSLEDLLMASGRPEFLLHGGLTGYRVEFVYEDEQLAFEAQRPELAYAEALLFLLPKVKPGISA